MKQATSESSVQAFIEFELNLLAEKVNVSGNLTDGQIQAIAQAIVTDYPNETIADFKICFTNAANGRYGKIWKLDGIEVGVWIGLYLEDKYTVHDNLWKEEKNQYKNKVFEDARSGSDWLTLWKEAIAEADRIGGVKTESKNITFLNNLRAMGDEEIKEKGQEKPKIEYYPKTSKEEIEKREKHLRYIRANYDARTGDPIKGVWVKESDWVDPLTGDKR